MAGTTTEARQDRAALGITMMLFAWALFSVVDSTVKWLVLAGVAVLPLAFMRYAVALALSVVMGLRSGHLFAAVSRRHVRILLLRGVLLTSATVLNFFALRYLPLTVVSSIMFSSPILASLLSMPLLGERVGPWRWGAILLGFAGVICVIRPFGADFHWASVMIVYNAMALALYSILTRELAGQIGPAVMQVYTSALGAAVLLPFAVWTWTAPQTPMDWTLFVLFGAFAWAGHDIFARAHLFAQASALMPFSYSYLLYMSLADWLVFSHVPDVLTVIGTMIIVTAGLVIWWRETMRSSLDA